jgi:predicted DNA-binding transcriptional regulator YafY
VDIIFEKRLPLKWGYEVDIDFRASEGGRSSLALQRAIEQAIESETLVQFNYHDESQGEVTKYVRVLGYVGRERTGHDFGDEATLALTEL